MPTIITQLKVFLASPSDVNEEREIVKKVIDETNITHGAVFNVEFKLVRWETHTYPNIGVDVQDPINKQINDDYDVFIGIMWQRFGTPTTNFSSGTQEEFERAYKKYLSDNQSTAILFYFKNAPVEINKIDLVQLSAVKNFKESLTNKGVSYRDFIQPSEFEDMLRLNLSAYLSHNYKKDTNNNEISVTNNDSEAEDELGMFDYIELGTTQMVEVAGIISRIGDFLGDITDKVHLYTDKINQLKSKPLDVQQREMIRIVDLYADDMITFSGRLGVELPVMNSKFNLSIDNYLNGFLIFREFNSDDTQKDELISSLDSLQTMIITGNGENKKMLDSIYGIPSLTKKITKAKKQTIKVLKELIEEYNIYYNLINQLKNNIENS